MSTIEIQAPMISINGTSARDLIEQNVTATHAVREAFRALQHAAPHGRDYQSDATGEAYKRARHQHNVRLTCLDDMIKELEEIGSQIVAQG